MSEAAGADSPDQTRLTKIFIGLAAVLGLAGFALNQTVPEPELRGAAGVQPLGLRSHRAHQHELQRVAEVAGLLEAQRRVEIFSEADGMVIEVGAEELDRVSAGQLLLRMDPLLAEIDVERAEAHMTRSRSELRLARANLERQRSLRGNSVASEVAYDRAVYDESVASAAVREGKANLRSARDAVSKHTIEVPFDGELRLFPVKVGELVRSGEQVGELLDVVKLRMTVGLSDWEVVAVTRDNTVDVTVEARPGNRYHGRIVRVGGAVDSRSHKFPVQLEIDNGAADLLPGMVARVRLNLGAPEELITVPREAVLLEYGLHSVFILKEQVGGGWLARKRRVELREIPFLPVELEVVSGLKAGEYVAVSALRQLDDGTLVSPQFESQTASHAPVRHPVGAPRSDRLDHLPEVSGEGG